MHQIVIVLITPHVKIENVSILALKKIHVQEMLIAKLFDTSQFVLVLTVTLEIQQPLVNCVSTHFWILHKWLGTMIVIQAGVINSFSIEPFKILEQLYSFWSAQTTHKTWNMLACQFACLKI